MTTLNGWVFSRETIVALIVNIVSGIVVYGLTRNPTSTFLTLAGLGASSVIFLTIRRFYIIASLSRIKGVHRDSRDPRPLLHKYFAEGHDIRILALRGALILGTERGAVSQIIKDLPKGWQGKIRILLLDCDSTLLLERAGELGIDPTEFRDQCLATARNIASLRQRFQVAMSLRYYDIPPLWRLILIDDRGFVSYYLGQRGHTRFHYEITGGEGSLFNAFSLFFERLWKASREVSL